MGRVSEILYCTWVDIGCVHGSGGKTPVVLQGVPATPLINQVNQMLSKCLKFKNYKQTNWWTKRFIEIASIFLKKRKNFT